LPLIPWLLLLPKPNVFSSHHCLQGLVKGAELCFRYPYFYFQHGESTSTASQLTSPANQKSKDLNKVSLLLQDLGVIFVLPELRVNLLSFFVCKTANRKINIHLHHTGFRLDSFLDCLCWRMWSENTSIFDPQWNQHFFCLI